MIDLFRHLRDLRPRCGGPFEKFRKIQKLHSGALIGQALEASRICLVVHCHLQHHCSTLVTMCNTDALPMQQFLKNEQQIITSSGYCFPGYFVNGLGFGCFFASVMNRIG